MKKLFIVFAVGLSLSVIYAAGWASGNRDTAAETREPVTVNLQEPVDNDLEDGNFGGHHEMPSPPRGRFPRLVLPGIMPRP